MLDHVWFEHVAPEYILMLSLLRCTRGLKLKTKIITQCLFNKSIISAGTLCMRERERGRWQPPSSQYLSSSLHLKWSAASRGDER